MQELVNTSTQDLLIDVSSKSKFDRDELHIPANLETDDVDNFITLTEKQWGEIEGCLPIRRWQEKQQLRVHDAGDGRNGG